MVEQTEMDLCDARTPPAQDDAVTDPFGAIPSVDIQSCDLDRAASEIGELRDENGVDLWHILKSLKGMGVRNVKLVE